ncbi:MAG TPA: prolyl-tRNA synthetase associated domain-containing protein [Williamwhitmania sp.]|nr:prolyl-tRNA synthetase associated domain-containing protein [Williamwhitmania sp.]
MNGSPELYTVLSNLNISFDYYEHPPTPTVEEAMIYWKDIEATHCKNLFFRNHKGNRHYLVVFDHRKTLEVKMLEEKLRQGKLSFASAQRMETHLGVTPGSVTPLAIINDAAKHVKLFLDMDIKRSEKVSFHPCINTASIVIKTADFIRFLDFIGNEYEWIEV